jgi:hypothetical protein
MEMHALHASVRARHFGSNLALSTLSPFHLDAGPLQLAFMCCVDWTHDGVAELMRAGRCRRTTHATPPAF